MEEQHDIEINDYIRIIWKWKWLIIIISLCFAVIAGLISFSMPKIYQATMVIEQGVIGLDDDSEVIELDTASNMKSKIEYQAYNGKVFKKLNVDPKELSLKFNAFQLTDSKAIKVSIETREANKGIQALSSLFHIASEEYRPYVDLRKTVLDQKIKMHKHKLNMYLDEKGKLVKQMAWTDANTDRMNGELKTLVAKEGGNEDKLTLFMYTSIIQQNISRYKDLEKKLGELLNLIETTESAMEVLETKKSFVENIKLIQPPQSSIYPIKPKRIFNVATAFIAGFIFSVFLSLVLEYIQKIRSHSEFPTNSA